jgi:hypothetical protein
MGNDNLTTILLLIVLGFLIYYLCKSNNANDSCKSDNIDNNINDNHNDNDNIKPKKVEKFVDTSNSSSNVANVNNVPSSIIISEPDQQKIQQEQLNKVLKPIVPTEQVLPNVKSLVNNDSITNESLNDINGFEPSDMINDGANLDEAFLCQKCNIPQDVVKMNDVKKYNAQDFLPKEINDKWFDTDFSQAKNNIQDDKLINTERYVIGINTVGQSLKCASYDIRGTVANPKFTVSPWNNSTYEADYNIKSLV